jgi:acyl carrier protein
MTTEQWHARPGRAEITGIATRLIAEMVGMPAESLSDETRIFLDLGLTSINVLELLMRLEDELGIEFDGDSLDYAHLETLGSLTAFISERTATP